MTSHAEPSAAPPHPTGARLAAMGQRHGVALIWLSTFFYATGPVMVGGSTVSGPVLSFWRLWMGVVLMGAATLVHGRVTGRWPTRAGWAWTVRAGLAFGVHQLMLMIAVKATSVVDVTLMQVLSPLIVGAMAVRLFGERPGRAFRTWSFVAIAGAVVVVLAGVAGPEGDPAGMALAVGNVAFFALYFVWSKQARDHIDVVPFLFGSVVAAAITVTTFVLVAGEQWSGPAGRDLLLAAGIAVVPGGIGHLCATYPLRWVPANVPPVVSLALPFLSGALAWLLLGEAITPLHLLGGAITIAGVAGAVRSPVGDLPPLPPLDTRP